MIIKGEVGLAFASVEVTKSKQFKYLQFNDYQSGVYHYCNSILNNEILKSNSPLI